MISIVAEIFILYKVFIKSKWKYKI
jgi:hypothetical protein